MYILNWLRKRIENLQGPWWLAVVAFVIVLPTLNIDFLTDDHQFRMIFQGAPGIPELKIPFCDTFRFHFEDDPELRHARMERGLLPWWANPEGNIAFFRPLTCLTHYVEYVLFDDLVWPMHLFNMLLFAGIAACLFIFYRRLLTSEWLAGLAGLLYTLDDARNLPVSWFSSRNVLLAGFFVVLVVLMHDKWRRDQWKPGAILSPLFLGLGLLSGEAALAATGYLFAYALCIEQGPIKNRILTLLPCAAVAVVWLFFYSHLGYGTYGSGSYANPTREPLYYIATAAQHIPILFTTHYALPESAFWMYLPAPHDLIFVVAAILFSALVLWLFAPLLRNEPTARFFALGMGLSLLLSAAALPQDRLLMMPGIGGMGLLALFLARSLDPPAWWPQYKPWRRVARIATPTWVVIHLVLAPVILLGSFAAMPLIEESNLRANESAPMDLEVSDDTVVIVNTMAEIMAPALPVTRSSLGQPVPRRTYMLYAGLGKVNITRTDETTLEVRPERGFLEAPWAQVYRRPSSNPMPAGTRVELDLMTAEVVETGEDGRPRMVRYTFSAPLGSTEFRWIAWDFSDRVYKPFTLPEVGETSIVGGENGIGISNIF